MPPICLLKLPQHITVVHESFIGILHGCKHVGTVIDVCLPKMISLHLLPQCSCRAHYVHHLRW